MPIPPAWLLIPAQAAPAGGMGDWTSMLLLFGAMGAIMYFLIWRPQQKEKKEREALLTSLSKGDQVITRGGLHGVVVNVDEQIIRVDLGGKATVTMDKEAVAARVDPNAAVDADGKK